MAAILFFLPSFTYLKAKFYCMETNQPTASTVVTPPPAAPGMFGTRIPSSVAFAVGILLFLLPISEVRCGGTKLATKSGLDYAMAKDWKPATGGLLNKNDMKEKTMSSDKQQTGNTQYFAIGALTLGLLGFLLSMGSNKTAGGGIVTGLLAAGSSIGLMLDEKNNFAQSLKSQAMDKAQEGADGFGLDKLGNTMNDMKPTLAFTPWFYVAVVAFVAAALFCYLRMRSSKT